MAKIFNNVCALLRRWTLLLAFKCKLLKVSRFAEFE